MHEVVRALRRARGGAALRPRRAAGRERPAGGCRLAEQAVLGELGEGSVQLAEQSLGGEDFAWFLEKVPGAHGPAGHAIAGRPTYDLHQGDFVVDERAIGVGARVLTAVALRQLSAA